MNPPAPSPELRRAQRLAAYLLEDPANPALLADACETALAAGQYEQAATHIAAAAELGLDPPAWRLRHARLCIAQRRLEEAARSLQQLQEGRDGNHAVVHDLAYVRLLQDRPQECRELAAPLLDVVADREMLQALQVLWLRASHRLQLLQEAWAWAQAELAGRRLQPQAQGVASLVALDLDLFEPARALADAALAAGAVQVEALVARASVALAEEETARAEQLLQQALACNRDDGRTWSALGLCSLQANDLPLAQTRLERALRTLSGHVGTWHALGWARLLQQDIAGAGAAFRHALDLDHNFAESHGAMGLVLALAGDKPQAGEHLERARRLDPANVTGRYASALLAGEAGDLGQLLALSRRLLHRPGFAAGTLADSVAVAIARRRK